MCWDVLGHAVLLGLVMANAFEIDGRVWQGARACQSISEHIKACSLEDGVLYYVLYSIIILYCFVMLFGCCLRPRFGENYCCLGRLWIFSILGTNAGDCW